MKKSLIIFACILAAIFMTGCSSTKKTNVKTYVMPCSDCVKADDAIRVWASGTSDSETTARKKAMMSASADLAALLEKNVEIITEEYTSVLNNGENGLSKSYLNEQSKITVKKTISGANIVCDEWVNKENGQYTNYIVLELKLNTFIDSFIEEVKKDSEQQLNKELLQELFEKNVKNNME